MSCVRSLLASCLLSLAAACTGASQSDTGGPLCANGQCALTAADGALANGDFESGLVGWTASGTTSTSSTAYSGSLSAQLGSATATGASSLAQTFTVPAGAAALTFWYQGFCNDKVQYAWAAATLVDNTTGASATLLANTCTKTGQWVQITSGPLTPGDSVTLTLSTQSEVYQTDYNYTLFDDVQLTTSGAGGGSGGGSAGGSGGGSAGGSGGGSAGGSGGGSAGGSGGGSAGGSGGGSAGGSGGGSAGGSGGGSAGGSGGGSGGSGGGSAGGSGESDGPPTRTASCTPLSQETGTAINTTHGRLDGTITYVVPLGGPSSCNGDNGHIHIQVSANGNIYDVAVDVGTSPGDALLYEADLALPDGAWSEGWHDDALSYKSLGLSASEFVSQVPATLAQTLESELASVNHVSIFGTAYSGGNGCHDVHYHSGQDGALVLEPLAATPHILFFRFSTDSF